MSGGFCDTPVARNRCNLVHVSRAPVNARLVACLHNIVLLCGDWMRSAAGDTGSLCGPWTWCQEQTLLGYSYPSKQLSSPSPRHSLYF